MIFESFIRGKIALYFSRQSITPVFDSGDRLKGIVIYTPAFGYELMNEITEVSNGRLSMGPGTLYGVLSRMQKDGFISLAEDDGRRKTYKITSEGEEALRKEYSRLMALVQDGIILKEGEKDE